MSLKSQSVSMFDLYCIGGPDGFYVGQAKHTKKGGWLRRLAEHRLGKGKASKGAYRLLAAGATARCIGTFSTSQHEINQLEARAWDKCVADGWVSAHQRPHDWKGWGATSHSTETREKLSVANSRAWKNPQLRARQSAAHCGHKVTEETRTKISESMRGWKFSHHTRGKISKALESTWKNPDTYAKRVAGMRAAWVLRRERMLSARQEAQ